MEPATRTQRLLAVLLDSALVSGVFAIAAYEPLPEAVRFLGLVAGAALFAANLFFLARRGQTVGKRLVGIRIVRQDTRLNGGFVVNVLIRGLANGLLSLVPGYFLVDSAFIFRENRRCLHDLLAGTVVIREGEAVSSVV